MERVPGSQQRTKNVRVELSMEFVLLKNVNESERVDTSIIDEDVKLSKLLFVTANRC